MVGIKKAATDPSALVQAIAAAFPEDAPKLLPALGLKLAQMQTVQTNFQFHHHSNTTTHISA